MRLLLLYYLSKLRSYAGKINYTHNVPLPKIKSPQKVLDYRPISLCNVLYKIVSKFLANRLQKMFPTIISGSQSVFISQVDSSWIT